jgi:CRISPR-associated protein Csb2
VRTVGTVARCFPAGLILPTMFCWQLAGDRRPSLFLALRLGEAVRAAVMRAGTRLGLVHMPDPFHGTNEGGPHEHAFWLSEDRDRDGCIDHVTVYAHCGLAPEVVGALAGTGHVWLNRRSTWQLIPLGLGRPRSGGLVGPACRWIAATAYVTPKHRTDVTGRVRPHLAPEAQLREEIARRGLPAPVSITWHEAIQAKEEILQAAHFVTTGRGRRAPSDCWRGAPTVDFAEPISGPLAFGFGAHFGLGLLVPTHLVIK